MQTYHKGEEYDRASQHFLNSGVFGELFANLGEFVRDTELEDLVRCLEFCSVTSDGLTLINARIPEVMLIVHLCFEQNKK